MSLVLHYLSMPYLLAGIELTLEVTALGLGGGLILGLILASMQLSRFWLLAAIARAYTVIFRGTPLILQMVFAYDALPHIGIKLPAVLAAGLALACNEAPFIAEMLRAGVLGVDRGQVTAGQALGMTPRILMWRVIAPQAIRTMIPAFGNEAVSALKNSSLASVVAVQELTLRSTQLASSTFDFFSIFFASGLLYLVLTTAISVIQLFVEWLLDLDRTTRRQRKLADYLPWRRVDLGTKLELAAATAANPEPAPAELTDTPPLALTREERARRAATIARNNIAVEVKDLTKSYGSQTVLDRLDLTVRVGEVVALLGPSGSGKSTLLRCINHLESWDSGTVRV
ncbi:MAG: ABC transporter permease subunit, partial [Pseudomonadota bacterium]